MRRLLLALALSWSIAAHAVVTPCVESAGFTNTGTDNSDNRVTTCTTNCACAFSSCTTVAAGLESARLVVDGAGVVVRWNTDAAFDAVMVWQHGGSGQTVMTPRTDTGDTTEWYELQNYSGGVRLVDILWQALLVDGYGNTDLQSGWFLRNDPRPATFESQGRRVAQVLQWVQDNLNTANKPLGWVTTSTGCISYLQALIDQRTFPVARTVDWIFFAGPPWWKFDSQCNASTPANTFVTDTTGALGASGQGAGTPDEWNAWLDYIYAQPSTNCVSGTQAASTATSGDPYLTCPTCNPTKYLGIFKAHIDTGGGVSDNTTGCTWSLGQLYNHAIMASATKTWERCTADAHGTSVTSTTSTCWTDFWNAATAWLDTL